jgi:catechol 2,3-dioxygenase-like lactoylglutathione lyase family enzyme
MNERPAFGMAVDDLRRTVEFYRDRLGLPVDTGTNVADTAVLTTTRGTRILLAGPRAPEWAEILDEQHTILRRDDPIYMVDTEFDQRRERLSKDQLVEYQLTERQWGDRLMELTDPDGYEITFMTVRERSRREILDLFESSRQQYREAVEQLTEEELNWRPEPDEWSVAEVVHHVADSNLTVLHVARVALADSGREYLSNPYDQNHYATELRYRERDARVALALFESTWDFLVSMVEAIPDGWERSSRTARGGETSVESYLLMLVTHALEHIEQVNEIRRAMGR